MKFCPVVKCLPVAYWPQTHTERAKYCLGDQMDAVAEMGQLTELGLLMACRMLAGWLYLPWLCNASC